MNGWLPNMTLKCRSSMYFILFYSIIKEVTISELFIFSMSNLRVSKKYLEEKGKKIKNYNYTWWYIWVIFFLEALAAL